MRQLALLPQFKTRSLSALMDIFRDRCLRKAANNRSGADTSHGFRCLGNQLQQEGTAEGGNFFSPGGGAHRLEPVHGRTGLTESLTSLVWQTFRNEQSGLKSVQGKASSARNHVSPVCVSHAIAFPFPVWGSDFGSAKLHTSSCTRPSVPSSDSSVSSGPRLPACDPSSLSTSAFCWLGQSKVTQLSQNWSGQMKKIKIQLTDTLEAV